MLNTYSIKEAKQTDRPGGVRWMERSEVCPNLNIRCWEESGNSLYEHVETYFLTHRKHLELRRTAVMVIVVASGGENAGSQAFDKNPRH